MKIWKIKHWKSYSVGPFPFVNSFCICNCQFAKRLQNAYIYTLVSYTAFLQQQKILSTDMKWNNCDSIVSCKQHFVRWKFRPGECKIKWKKMQPLLNIRRLRAKLFEYNEVGIRYVDPLKVATKLGSCRDKHAQIFSNLFSI